MISRNYSNTLMEQLFLFFTELFVLLTAFAVFPTRASLYLNDWELLIVKSALLSGTSSLLNCHELISPVTKINASEKSQKLNLILSASNFIELIWLYLSFAVWLSITDHFL